MGEESGVTTEGAVCRDADLTRRHASRCRPLPEDRPEIDGGRPRRNGLVEGLVDFGSDLVAPTTNGGPEVDVDIGRSGRELSSHRLQRHPEDAVCGTTPSRVDHGHRLSPRIDDEDGNAVGHGDREERAGTIGEVPVTGIDEDERVLRLLPGPAPEPDLSSVGLAGVDDDAHAESFGQRPPVVTDLGLRASPGEEPKVEGPSRVSGPRRTLDEPRKRLSPRFVDEGRAGSMGHLRDYGEVGTRDAMRHGGGVTEGNDCEGVNGKTRMLTCTRSNCRRARTSGSRPALLPPGQLR